MKQINILTIKDCTDENPYEVDMEGRLIIIKVGCFKDEYKEAKYQLVRCTGGFGSKPEANGNAIFVKELFENGERARLERYDKPILGFPTDECVKEWENTYGIIKEG